MRITWLLEVADQLWGGVKKALEDANWLSARGHQVTVLSRSGPPSWMQLQCTFRQVPDFQGQQIPASDVVIGTFWTTVPFAAASGKGAPVHYCQGYEGDNPENAGRRGQIEQVYRLPGVAHVTISPNLTRLLRERFDIQAREVVYAIDHEVHFAGPARPPHRPVRVALIGPYQVAWKDIDTGIEACKLAAKAGLSLQLVRVTNTQKAKEECDLPFPVEWHERLAPAAMGEIYRSCDVFLGTSCGEEEGFFMPAIEAMACGVPAVLTDIPCFRAYAEGGNYALFVPAKDVAAMAEAMVVASSVTNVREQLREFGLQTAARFHQDAHGQALEEALQQIATQHGGTRAPVVVPRPAPKALDGDQLAGEVATTLKAHSAQLQDQGEYALAVRFLLAAVALAPLQLELLRDLAYAKYLAGDDHGALAIYDQLRELGADDTDLHQSRALLLHSMGRPGEAAAAFRAAIDGGAQSAESYNSLGVVLYQSGDHGAARRSFAEALRLHPGHADAVANLAALQPPDGT